MRVAMGVRDVLRGTCWPILSSCRRSIWNRKNYCREESLVSQPFLKLLAAEWAAAVIRRSARELHKPKCSCQFKAGLFPLALPLPARALRASLATEQRFPPAHSSSGVQRTRAPATATMTATTHLPIDIRPLNQTLAPAHPDDVFDELPDETVLKTGWLTKKGRRGVSSPIYCGKETNLLVRIGRNAGSYCGQTDWPTTRTKRYLRATYLTLPGADNDRNTKH